MKNIDKHRKEIISAAEKSLEELKKVAEMNIDLSELDPEKAKIAAQAKKIAVFEAFDILQKISEEVGNSSSDSNSKDFFDGIESKI